MAGNQAVQLIRDFETAWNTQSRQRIMNYFTEDAVITMKPAPQPPLRETYRGHQEIREFVDLMLPNFHVESRNHRVESNHVTWDSTVRSNLFRQMGLEQAECTTEAVIQGNRLRSFTTTLLKGAERGQPALQNNIDRVRQLMESVFNRSDYSLIDRYVDDRYVNYAPNNPPDLQRGRAGFKQFADIYRTAFPDKHLTFHDCLADGDSVVLRWTATGTHQGEIMGLAPTNKCFSVTGLSLFRLENGKVVEEWDQWDALGLMQQLGALPAPEEHVTITRKTRAKRT